jgi:thiol:disulfide interchange protein DsbD
MAQAGTQTRIGIRFEMDKDWHIYWKNPGDSGEPPQIHWQLPVGVTSGALQWPLPKRLKTSAGTDYGYEGNVVLFSALNIPASVQPGNNLVVGSDLRWLVCHDTCIPQHADLKANLRISNASTVDPRARVLLTAASKRIPESLPDMLHVAAASSPNHLLLRFVAGAAIIRAEFFPEEPEQIDNSAPQELVNTGGILQLELKKSDHLQRDPERLKGVLVLNEQHSYQVDLPIRNSAEKERKQ